MLSSCCFCSSFDNHEVLWCERRSSEDEPGASPGGGGGGMVPSGSRMASECSEDFEGLTFWPISPASARISWSKMAICTSTSSLPLRDMRERVSSMKSSISSSSRSVTRSSISSHPETSALRSCRWNRCSNVRGSCSRFTIGLNRSSSPTCRASSSIVPKTVLWPSGEKTASAQRTSTHFCNKFSCWHRSREPPDAANEWQTCLYWIKLLSPASVLIRALTQRMPASSF
mmetsp:Transcript_5017/g.12790  ORF Transcript_5017/g.12790 Transcript_5017/m.12790 type:complete len:229 (+) Transcript_5017:1939-2625(+)